MQKILSRALGPDQYFFQNHYFFLTQTIYNIIKYFRAQKFLMENNSLSCQELFPSACFFGHKSTSWIDVVRGKRKKKQEMTMTGKMSNKLQIFRRMSVQWKLVSKLIVR